MTRTRKDKLQVGKRNNLSQHTTQHTETGILQEEMMTMLRLQSFLLFCLFIVNCDSAGRLPIAAECHLPHNDVCSLAARPSDQVFLIQNTNLLNYANYLTWSAFIKLYPKIAINHFFCQMFPICQNSNIGVTWVIYGSQKKTPGHRDTSQKKTPPFLRNSMRKQEKKSKKPVSFSKPLYRFSLSLSLNIFILSEILPDLVANCVCTYCFSSNLPEKTAKFVVP